MLDCKTLAKILSEEFEQDDWGLIDPTLFKYVKEGEETMTSRDLEGVLTRVCDRINNNISGTNMTSYVYVFVRVDLPSKSQVAVQACHASLELGAMVQGSEIPWKSLPMVLIGVRDRRRLLQEYRKVTSFRDQDGGLLVSLFREPDLGNQPTAMAVLAETQEHRDLFRRWKTLDLDM